MKVLPQKFNFGTPTPCCTPLHARARNSQTKRHNTPDSRKHTAKCCWTLATFECGTGVQHLQSACTHGVLVSMLAVPDSLSGCGGGPTLGAEWAWLKDGIRVRNACQGNFLGRLVMDDVACTVRHRDLAAAVDDQYCLWSRANRQGAAVCRDNALLRTSVQRQRVERTVQQDNRAFSQVLVWSLCSKRAGPVGLQRTRRFQDWAVL